MEGEESLCEFEAVMALLEQMMLVLLVVLLSPVHRMEEEKWKKKDEWALDGWESMTIVAVWKCKAED